MEYTALKVLDSIDDSVSVYRLVVSLARRCHDLTRLRIGGHRVHLIEEAFREEMQSRDAAPGDAREVPPGAEPRI